MIELSQRDKKVIIFGSIFVLVFLCFQLFYFPVVEKNEKLKRMVQVRQDQYNEMLVLQDKYTKISGRQDNTSTANYDNNKNFSLFAFIDRQALQSGIKKNVAFMKPYTNELEKSKFKKVIVKVKLNNLYLIELVNFLYKIESSNNLVSITSVSLSRSGKKEFLMDAVIETQTMIPKDTVPKNTVPRDTVPRDAA